MNKYPIITISREYGCGGREIGRKLAEKLGLPYYDYEKISNIASRDSGYSEELFENADKKASNSLMYSMSLIGTGGPYNMPLNDRLFLIQSGIIRTIADQGPAVIVGRCSDYVLMDYTRCVNIFIFADIETKIKRVMQRKNVSEKEAAQLALISDKRRATYYNYYSDRRWGKMENYDISVNTSNTDLDSVVDVLKAYVETTLGDELTNAKKEAGL